MIDDTQYLDTPEQWDELARRCLSAGAMGLDSEYYGVPEGKSPIGRSRVHVWSVAVRTEGRSPRGYRSAVGWCLPAAALAHPPLVAVLEDPRIRKAVHNQSVDHHALANHGVTLRGSVNTLGLLRWHMPGLISTPGRFALKPVMEKVLGYPPVAEFGDVVGLETTIPWSTFRTEKRSACSCGEAGCRKRKAEPLDDERLGAEWDVDVGWWVQRHDKTQVAERIETRHEKKFEADIPLHWITRDSMPERWDLLVRYAIVDAVAALQVEDVCGAVADPAPFPFGDKRPAFSQAVEESIIAMEAVGFNVDVEWCAATVKTAEDDECRELDWLARWWGVNGLDEWKEVSREELLGVQRGVLDALWGSTSQKIELFAAMGFPAAPIWGKGRVKRGDVKLDHTAMAWIGANCREAKQLCEHLLKLQRIRSGKKYLVKLRDSGGVVHPICGPDGDDDERAGAVTGRLGIKGELEAQQLPKEGEKDLYGIRRAIVA